MIAVVKDDEGNIIQEFDCTPETWCQGMRSGETGAMCGGCDGCGIAQAEYAGYRLEYIDNHGVTHYPERPVEKLPVNWKEEGF